MTWLSRQEIAAVVAEALARHVITGCITARLARGCQISRRVTASLIAWNEVTARVTDRLVRVTRDEVAFCVTVSLVAGGDVAIRVTVSLVTDRRNDIASRVTATRNRRH